MSISSFKSCATTFLCLLIMFLGIRTGLWLAENESCLEDEKMSAEKKTDCPVVIYLNKRVVPYISDIRSDPLASSQEHCVGTVLTLP